MKSSRTSCLASVTFRKSVGLLVASAKNQVSSILSKLGVRDRTRAVLKAIQAGVV